MTDYLGKFILDHKVAFVCGAVGLIGAETSEALGQAGATVVLLDVDRKKGKQLEVNLQSQGLKAHFELFDVTALEKMESQLTALAKKYKGLDVWVNCSYPRTKDWGRPVESLSLGSLRKNIDMQLNSSLWSSRLVALLMKKNKIKGSIINLGSIYGVVGNDFSVYEGTSLTSPMAYSAIKGGVIGFTRYLASYFGAYHIRVNCLCPGGVFDNQNKRFVKNYNKKVPLKRMGTPQDMASSVLFLASDASSYITGTAFMVDGGWTII